MSVHPTTLALEDTVAALQGIATYTGAAREQLAARADEDLLDVLRIVEEEARKALTPSWAKTRRGAPARTLPLAGARPRPPQPPIPAERVTRETAAELLLDPPPLVERMRVFDLLRLVPDIGHDGARQVLRRTMIGEQRPVGSLSLRGERLVLARVLRDEAGVIA